MTTLLLATQLVEQFVAKKQARIDKAKTLNEGIAPTIDKHDRLHAPHDGYVWGEYWNDIYLGGQYLPDPDEYRISETACKVKVLSELKPELIKLFSIFSRDNDNVVVDLGKEKIPTVVEFGKEWTQKEGVVCYAYIRNLPQSLHNELSKIPLIHNGLDLTKSQGNHYFNNNDKITIKVIDIQNICSIPSAYGTIWLDKLILDDGKEVFFKGGQNIALNAIETLSKRKRQKDWYILPSEKNAYYDDLCLELSVIIEHSEYKGVKQTMIKKPKLTESEYNDWFILEGFDNDYNCGLDLTKNKLSKHEKIVLKRHGLI